MTAPAPAPARPLPTAEDFLAEAITQRFAGRIALVSSFGTEAAVLLHMVSRIDAAVPVLFLDTGKLFGETLRYRDALIARLGLREVRVLRPDADALAREDADGLLFHRDADRCCAIRKVEPLDRALAGFDAWINGRKGFHGGARAALPLEEADGPRVKLTPLAGWNARDLDAYFARHDLPRHPLQADGFLSVGCLPCTERASNPDDPRSGRWAGQGKTECGIHSRRPAAATPKLERRNTAHWRDTWQDAWWPVG